MTEDEARKTWCHRTVRLVLVEGLDPKCCCIASSCMAWRWNFERTDQNEAQAAAFPSAKPTTYHRLETGYCGLAGRPGP